MAQTIVLPSASAQTIIKPPGGTYQFQVNQDCTVCFGTASSPGSFPPIEGNTYQWKAGFTYGPYGIPPNVNDSLPYNTAAPNSPCNPSGGIAAAIHVIVVGAGITGRTSETKKAPAKKKSGAKKSAGKTRKSSTARKAAPKKAKKAAKKASKKSAGKSKSTAKSRAKGKKKSAKSRSRR